MDLAALNASFARAGALAFEMSPLGGVVARLGHGTDTATVDPGPNEAARRTEQDDEYYSRRSRAS